MLLVVDGLGYQQVQNLSSSLLLNASLCDRLTSVFPSTTASAITSLLTASAPQQHALVGWHTHFSEVDDVLAPLPFISRRNRNAVPHVMPEHLFTPALITDEAMVQERLIYPADIAHSQYSEHFAGARKIHAYANLEEMSAIIDEVLAGAGDVRQYLYVYYPEVDATAHHFGSKSPQTEAVITEFDECLQRLVDRRSAREAAVWLTADHGFVDPSATECLDLADFPPLQQCLSQPLCGEPRVAFCHVKPDCETSFERICETQLAPIADVYRSECLIDHGLYGLGAVHPQLRHRVGDYTLIMKERYLLQDWLEGERRFVLKGSHGGTSGDEMYVPLCLLTP